MIEPLCGTQERAGRGEEQHYRNNGCNKLREQGVLKYSKVSGCTQ